MAAGGRTPRACMRGPAGGRELRGDGRGTDRHRHDAVGALRRRARNRGVRAERASPRLALKMGADAAVDPRMHNPAGKVEQLTGAGPQVIFECIGAPGAMAKRSHTGSARAV